MEKSEVFALTLAFVGVLWAVITTFAARYANRQEKDLEKLSEKDNELFNALIETQQKNTESSNRLSLAVDRLTQTVANMENQAAERHSTLTGRIDDLHEGQELVRARMHWVINKLTVVKFALEKLGSDIKGDWESP